MRLFYVLSNYSWIVVEDPKVINCIQVGDIVKAHYEFGFLDALTSMMYG